MMRTYELAIDGRLRLLEPNSLSSARPAGSAVRWVRTTGPAYEGLQESLRDLGVPDHLVTEALQDGETRSGVAIAEGVLLVAFPVRASVEARILGLRLACTPTTIVTSEMEALPAIDRLVAERSAAEQPPQATVPALALDILERSARGVGPAYLTLRQSADDLAETLEHDPMGVPPEALLDMKRRVGRLAMLWEDQGFCFVELQRRRSFFSESEAIRDRLRDLISDADRGLKLLERLEVRVRDLGQHYAHCLEEATSHRLNILAVLSAIYLPTTLIAGIYGMNFDNIPVTHMRHGYLLVMSLMVFVVLGQLWYFRRRGWFK